MKDNVGAVSITMNQGDSVLINGKDKAEVVYKGKYGSRQARVVFIADKEVKFIRIKAADRIRVGK